MSLGLVFLDDFGRDRIACSDIGIILREGGKGGSQRLKRRLAPVRQSK